MTTAERDDFAKKEQEMRAEPEGKHLEQVVDLQAIVLSANGVDGSEGVQAMEGERTEI